MEAEKPQIAEDPNFAADKARAEQTLLNNLQTQAQSDTANLMTRYGTRLALGAASITPIAPATDAAASPMPNLANLFKGAA